MDTSMADITENCCTNLQKETENNAEKKKVANKLAQAKYRDKRKKEWQSLLIDRQRLLLANKEMKTELQEARRAIAAGNFAVDKDASPPTHMLPIAETTPNKSGHQFGTDLPLPTENLLTLSPPTTETRSATERTVVGGHHMPSSDMSRTTTTGPPNSARSHPSAMLNSLQGNGITSMKELTKLSFAVRHINDRLKKIEMNLVEILNKQTTTQLEGYSRTRAARKPIVAKNSTRKSISRACKRDKAPTFE